MTKYIKNPISGKLRGVTYEDGKIIDVHIRDTDDVVKVFVPVRHGRWEKQSGLYSCSECGMTCPYDVQADVIEYWVCNYCPKCGAKMDLEDEEDNNANKKID